jgi:hypothetical protein
MWSDAGSDFERPGPRLRDYVRAVKACFTAFRSGKLDHHGDFYDLDFITPQWSAGPIDAPDPKVDVAVNPWMLRMAARSPMACTSTRWANQPTSPGMSSQMWLRERRSRAAHRRTSR